MIEKELAIIGGGAAGSSAAIYADRSNIDSIIVTEEFGGQLMLTKKIENYLGVPEASGADLSSKFEEHVKKYDVDIEKSRVEKVVKKEDSYLLRTESDDIKAKSVIVATGTKARKLDVPGEEEFNNKGIAYCAVCDGPLYQDEEVAIIGGGYAGTEAALYMSDIAEKVYLINYNGELSGEPITLEKIPEKDNIELIGNADTQKFFGGEFLEGLRYEDRETGEEEELEVSAAFIEIGRIPNSKIVDFVEKNERGKILTDEKQATSEPGVFAAGDVSDIPKEQAIVAAGQGTVASLEAKKYLQENL
ncbi:MAG: FAD-dependent oxidoreductase [Candidatus Nanohaloarchaeota archaeon QJJ-9]|nr:FAD-dependent oxidoreductase [Candidatus Nanohaloarchaeota archaeon QJJ-9]